VTDTAVYVAPAVAAVRALWDRSGGRAGLVIGAQLAAFADALGAAHAAREHAAEVLVDNWLDAPRWRTEGQSTTTGSLSPADARLAVARDHGFASWSVVEGACDPVFERAVDAVVLGRIGSWMPARTSRRGSTRTEQRPTHWRCSDQAHIPEPPVWLRTSNGRSLH
jgi:hypothetical protein